MVTNTANLSTKAKKGELIKIILQCVWTSVVPGDGIDNDCDGKIDEEIRDSRDNDGDGVIDEDLELVRK